MERGWVMAVCALLAGSLAVVSAGPEAAAQVSVERTVSGSVYAFGDAEASPPPSFEQVLLPVDLVADPSTEGYWRTDALGRVEASGGAEHAGSMASVPLNAPVVAMTPTASGDGYWLAASDGGVFVFGDAQFHGSMGAIPLNAPIVDIVPTATGDGYWLAAADGGVFAFGDAQFHGSMGGIRLNAPVVAMDTTPIGDGYWLAAADGGVFAFGSAGFFGSAGSLPLVSPVMGFAAANAADGYWLAAQDGGIFTYGAADFFGSLGGSADRRFTAFAVDDLGDGYWLSGPSDSAPIGLFRTLREAETRLDRAQETWDPIGAGAVLQTSGELAHVGGKAWVEWIGAVELGRYFTRYDDLELVPGIGPGTGCDGGTAPASFPTAPVEPAAAQLDDASRIYGLHHEAFADGCERIVLVFEDADEIFEPADGIAPGTSVLSVGTRVEVTLPFTQAPGGPAILSDLASVSSRAQLFTVSVPPGGADPREAHLGTIHLDRARATQVTYLTDPGRLVVDIGPATSAPGAADVPIVGRRATDDPDVASRPFLAVTDSSGSSLPLEVTGIASIFDRGGQTDVDESTVEVRLREPAAMPGDGAPVSATYSGGVTGTTTTTTHYPVSTDGWIGAWGNFSFAVDGIAPGSYELFVGDVVDGVEAGVYLDVTVDP